MKIINFGSLNIDKVCSVEEFVQPGETIMATGYSVNAGGKGLNQSVAAARAGAQVLHAGAVGSDGLFLKEILADAGADVSCLRVMDTESGCAFIEVNSKGQNRIIVSAGTNRMYTEEYIKNVLEKAEAGDFVLLQNEINNMPYIMKKAHERGLRIAFNAAPREVGSASAQQTDQRPAALACKHRKKYLDFHATVIPHFAVTDKGTKIL